MSMRRLIGISLACLVTSACAIEKTPEESTSNAPDDPARFPQANGETPTDKSPVSPGGLLADRGSADYGSERVERRLAAFEPTAEADGGIPDPHCSPLRTTGITLFGKAAWYNFVGRQTASGEILDSVTATADVFSAGRLSTLTKVQRSSGSLCRRERQPSKADREDEGRAAAGLIRTRR
jgi:rare lipoprotein A (peptidoglycan hydrolase)